MRFRIIGRITDVEVIAVGKQTRTWTIFKERKGSMAQA
jgi:hypothetical protein